jgi:hypothetical protein
MTESELLPTAGNGMVVRFRDCEIQSFRKFGFRVIRYGKLRLGGTAPGWQELFHVLQHWSVQPCVRPFNAVHITAGHNALRRSGPDQTDAFDNVLTQVGCPDRRIDRLCITCCSPSQPLHHADCPARSRLARKRDGFLVSLAPGHHGPDHPRNLVGERDSRNLGRLARKAVSQGRCLVPWILA